MFPPAKPVTRKDSKEGNIELKGTWSAERNKVTIPKAKPVGKPPPPPPPVKPLTVKDRIEKVETGGLRSQVQQKKKELKQRLGFGPQQATPTIPELKETSSETETSSSKPQAPMTEADKKGY